MTEHWTLEQYHQQKRKGTGRWNRNRPVTHDGIKFPSTVEGNIYLELRLRERAGQIANLKPSPKHPKQPKFVLQPTSKDAHTGETIKVIQYIADFMYDDLETGKTMVIDVKGKTKDRHGNIIPLTDAVFRLKWKLVRVMYPQYCFEIMTRGK